MIEKSSLINKKNKEENAFELENFLYNESMYPTINLGHIVNEEDILNNGFVRKNIYIENMIINYYTCDEDNNIIIYEEPNTEDIIMQYTNNFATLKESINPNNLNKKFNNNINKLLEKTNTYYGIEGSILNENTSFILESNKDYSLVYDNPLLNAYAFKLLNEKYNELSHLNEEYELALNEECINGITRPIISTIDPMEDSIVNIKQVGFKEDYENHYSIIIK